MGLFEKFKLGRTKRRNNFYNLVNRYAYMCIGRKELKFCDGKFYSKQEMNQVQYAYKTHDIKYVDLCNEYS